MITTQTYSYAIPPLLGAGNGYSLSKDPTFTFSVIDKYGQNVASRAQYGGANSLFFDIDVMSANGSFAVSGKNIETGVVGPSYVFSQEKNALAFGGVPKRDYKLVFKLRETSPLSFSSGIYSVSHNAAQISGITNITDGTEVSGNPLSTGRIDISLNLSNSDYYQIDKFEIYTGASSSFGVVTGTGAGANLLKSVAVFDQGAAHTLSIYEGEQPFDNQYYYYKIVPYDSFGSGIMYFSPPISGIMFGSSAPEEAISDAFARSIVVLSNGAYCIQTLHTGEIVGPDYQILDVIANISGNIITGGFYNSNLGSSAGQSETYPFRTIKYTAQLTDASGYCSSREILITDNTLSNISGHSGLSVSEYGCSDSGNLTRFLVSGEGTGISDYSRGTGYIYLMGQLQNPGGQYKLWRTIL